MAKEGGFYEVAEKLRQQIQQGQYQPGQKLPSEYVLATDFAVSRLTIRKGIAVLMEEHLLAKEVGKGTYVMKPAKITSGAAGLVGFTEKAREKGLIASSQILACERLLTIPKSVASFFAEGNTSQEQELLQIKRLRLLADEAMTVENLVIPKRYLPNPSAEVLRGSLFNEIEKQIEIGYSHQEVEAVVNPEIAKLLTVEEHAPLLFVHSLTYSPAGKPILYDTSYYRGDKYTFSNTLQRKRYR